MHTDITPIPALKDNYIWAIINRTNNTVLIVDPGEAEPVNTFLHEHKLTLSGILLTHHHWDHTNGAASLSKQHHVPVIGPEKDRIAGLTRAVHEGDEVNIAGFPLTFKVMEIPGHTLGHIAYYSPGMLFCGDTLFAAGCGRIFEGTPPQMFATLQKLAALPDDTNVYCAHEYTVNNLRFAEVVEPDNANIQKRMQKVRELREQQLPSLPSTLGEEKATNPFLRCDTVDEFTRLRKLKDDFR